MQQDLRELFKKESKEEKHTFHKGHETRFIDRLERELPQKKKAKFLIFKIAASLVLLMSLGYFGFEKYAQEDLIKVTVIENEKKNQDTNGISLGDLSPDLKKVESYYVANINFELSKLDVSEENKGFTDSYMLQLSELNTEYKKLNTELNQLGPNDHTISALIENLQLRLQLLQKLKKKLNELNTSKNEQVETNTI